MIISVSELFMLVFALMFAYKGILRGNTHDAIIYGVLHLSFLIQAVGG